MADETATDAGEEAAEAAAVALEAEADEAELTAEKAKAVLDHVAKIAAARAVGRSVHELERELRRRVVPIATLHRDHRFPKLKGTNRRGQRLNPSTFAHFDDVEHWLFEVRKCQLMCPNCHTVKSVFEARHLHGKTRSKNRSCAQNALRNVEFREFDVKLKLGELDAGADVGGRSDFGCCANCDLRPVDQEAAVVAFLERILEQRGIETSLDELLESWADDAEVAKKALLSAMLQFAHTKEAEAGKARNVSSLAYNNSGSPGRRIHLYMIEIGCARNIKCRPLCPKCHFLDDTAQRVLERQEDLRERASRTPSPQTVGAESP